MGPAVPVPQTNRLLGRVSRTRLSPPARRETSVPCERFVPWSCVLLLAACTPALAPLPPPPPAALTIADETRQAFAPTLPADARLVQTPAWATLEAVWGTYDPPLSGPYGGPIQVAFTGDRHTLILLGSRGELWLWDRDERATRRRIDACTVPERMDVAHVLATSTDGLVAVGFRSGRYCVADLSSGNRTATIEANDLTRGYGVGLMVARLAAGRLVTYGSTLPASFAMKLGDANYPPAGGELRSWDARTGAKVSDATIGAAWTAAFSPDGERFVVVPVKSQVISDELLMLARTGEVLWRRKVPTGHSVQRAVFATNDTLLATDGHRLFSISVGDGALLGFFEAPGLPTGPLYSDILPQNAGIAVTPDGRHAITDLDGLFVLWDVDARREVARASTKSQDVLRFVGFRDVAPSPDGSMFVTATGSVLSTSGLELIDAPSGPVSTLAVSGDARRALAWRALRRSREFDVWDAASRSLRRWPRPSRAPGLGDDPRAVALSNDGARAAIRASDFVELREWSSGRVLWWSHNDLWATTSLSPDGHAIATFVWDWKESHFFVTLRDAAKGTILWQNRQERPRSESLLFTSSGRQLVFLDADSRLVVLDARDGSVLRRAGPTEAGTWTLAGRARALVVGEREKSIASYDLDTGHQLWRSSEGKEATSDGVRVVAWPDGGAFLELDDTLIRRRSVETGAQIGDPINLGPSADAPRQLALSSDGQTLVVGSRRGVLLRFRVRASE